MEKVIKKLELLRKEMKKHRIDVYILPGTDPHQNEYLPEHWKRRLFISGFTGSAGTISVSMDKAMLWTDGRYEIQAKKELEGTGFDFFIKDQQSPALASELEWAQNEIKDKKTATIGFDSQLLNINQADMITRLLGDKENVKIKFMKDNIIDAIWKKRPQLPESPVVFRSSDYESVSSSDKLKDLRYYMSEKKADILVVSNLESIARLLNIRAQDIEYTPLAISYLIVEDDKLHLFINKKRLGKAYKSNLPENTKILPYSDFAEKIAIISRKKTIILDPSEISQWVKDKISKTAKVIKDSSPLIKIKAIKNSFEIERMLEAHVIDGVSMVKTIKWVKDNVSKKKQLTEYDVLEKNIEFKKENELFQSPSFASIVSYGANGAVIHYKPKADNCSKILPSGVLLIDSGSQYPNGTTDITRTIKIGDVNQEMIRNYTRVLKGHINASMMKFPHGTKGYQIDVLARQFLWKEGLDYKHGTGHGIGYYTCVHETSGVGIGPLRTMILEPGMTMSNEPGFYKEGEYGIRVENIIVVEQDEVLSKTNQNKNFLKFRQLTLCPYERELILTEMLSDEEVCWINEYHKLVFEKLSPQIKDSKLSKWLDKACAPLSTN